MHPRVVLIGIGNPDRGEDAAGRLVVRRLVGTLPKQVEIVEVNGEATSIMARLQGADAAIVVDACSSGAPAGTVQRFDVAAEPLPDHTFGVSTHGFGLASAIELARTLGDLPAYCVVYAIEGQSYEMGEPLSPPVAAAVDGLATRLRTEFAQLEQARGQVDA